MIINSQKWSTEHEFSRRYDAIFVGQVIDDRGKIAIEHISNLSGSIFTLDYNAENFTLSVTVEGQITDKIIVDDLDGFFNQFSGYSILLEATTLGFAEVILSCCHFSKILRNIDIVYVEPRTYRGRTQLLHRRDFELSEMANSFHGIPGFSFHLDKDLKKKVVFFMGFEARRLDSLLEDFHMIKPDDSCLVFGVPPFQSGWENNAFANNIDVLEGRNFSCEIYYCGADNPADVIQTLEEIYNGLNIDENERLFVSPIGTKPHGIGAALFAATHENVGVLFDHPVKKPDRTSDTSCWHLYEVIF